MIDRDKLEYYTKLLGYNADRVRIALNLLIFIAFFGISPGRTFFKYIPYPSIAFFMLIAYTAFLISTLFIFFRYGEKLSKITNNKYIYLLVFGLLLVLVLAVYPVADGLKAFGRGSDQDDCVILGVKHLLNLENPYISRTYRGNPCSTGPGVIFAYLPLVAVNLYEIGSVLFMMLTVWYLYKYYHPSIAGFYTLTIITNPLCIELMVVGSDLFFVGFIIVFTSLYLERHIHNLKFTQVLFSSVIVGLLASSRINMPILVGLFSIPVFLRSKIMGLWMFFISTFVALAPGLTIYLANPAQFTPLHLIQKANLFLPKREKVIISILMVIFFLFTLSLYKRNKSSISTILLWSLMPMFGGLWTAGLAYVGYSFSQLEHFNYLIPILPLSSVTCLRDLYTLKESKIRYI